MAIYGKGVDFLREQNKRLGGGRGSGFKKLWLKEGETARFYFLTDLGDAPVALVHGVMKQGRGGKPFTRDVLCAKRDADDETPCALCANPDAQGPWPRLVQYVYVTSVFHAQQTDKKWEPRRGAAGTVYEEKSESVWLLTAKPRLQEQLIGAYSGDPADEDYAERTPTLCDALYLLRCTGSGTQKTETLERKTAIPRLPDAALAAQAKLPAIEDTVIAEFSDRGVTTARGREEAREPTTGFTHDHQPDDDESVDF